MSSSDTSFTSKGPIAWMTRNSVAANLFMLVLLILGTMGMFTVKQVVFPEFSLDLVGVRIAYPGASPDEVEQGINLAVEEAVRGVDGVKRVTSTASEGFGQTSVELLISADPDKVLADVKTAIDGIRSFPEEAEQPAIALASRRSRVITLVLHGFQDPATLHQLAEQARAALLDHPDITQVELGGVRPLEISVEIPSENLLAYGLTLEQVAQQIRLGSYDLPGGSVDTQNGDLLVRVADRVEEGHRYGDLIIRGGRTGGEVRLDDIATITDGYADTDTETWFNGEPAVRIMAYRVGNETPARVAKATREYADSLSSQLPSNIGIEIWEDDFKILDQRIDLLI
jgi:multidrug efflux pump subunit AcrB